MYFLPFLYFAGLTYYFFRRNNTFDIATYISALFTVTSFFCIVMVMGGFLKGGGVLFDGWEPEFDFIPTILYCFLITVTIIPFSFIRVDKLETVSNAHRIVLYFFTAFILLQGATIYYLVGNFITDLLHGDFKFIKDASYAGDITPADALVMTMPMPVQLMYFTCSMTLLGIPLFFYYSCIERRSLWLTSSLLLASISPVLRGVLAADRTEIIHYGLMFLFSIVLFQNFIQRKIRAFLIIVSVPVVAVFITYVLAVSSSRFEDTDAGSEGTLIEYAGQSYANFCYFYNYHNSSLYYLEREFPLVSYFIFKRQYTETKEERTAKEGFFIGVFASHIGSWFLDVGIVGCTTITLLFFVICCLVINRYERREFDIADLMMVFILGAVPTFGIFYYRYYSIYTSFIYVPAILLFLYSKVDIIWSKDESTESS